MSNNDFDFLTDLFNTVEYKTTRKESQTSDLEDYLQRLFMDLDKQARVKKPVKKPEIKQSADTKQACNEGCACNKGKMTVPEIRSVYFNDDPGKKTVVVVFTDNTKVVKKAVADDLFDLNIGVALCVCERMYGGKTKFHNAVKKLAGFTDKRAKIYESAPTTTTKTNKK